MIGVDRTATGTVGAHGAATHAVPKLGRAVSRG
jgi:hypothetical protein